ncbi:hypothetical protein GCM10023187_26920 [Nibrella viscosa]|uniref:DUF4143 domain-containing protein n=1 Tax=Nibrella viscosa TaxID=1084524 RepID=A0ABP8KH63_9BACT
MDEIQLVPNSTSVIKYLYDTYQVKFIVTGSSSLLGSTLGIHRQKIKDYLNLLEYTYFIHMVPAFTRNVDRELSRQEKVYLADTGLLQTLGQVSSGQVFENAIAIQLKRLGELHYYQKATGQEIDFVLNSDQAIEVKETPAPHDLQVLQNRAKAIQLEKRVLIGRYQPGSDFANFVWGGNVF